MFVIPEAGTSMLSERSHDLEHCMLLGRTQPRAQDDGGIGQEYPSYLASEGHSWPENKGLRFAVIGEGGSDGFVL